jgi:CBS domain-containing protein
VRTRDIMTYPVHTVRDGDPVEEAAAILANKHITAVPVVDAHECVVGMIDESDLWRWRVEHADAWPGAAAGDVMTSGVVSVRSDTDTGKAAATMLQHAVHTLPVLDDGQLVGVISRGDLLRTLVTTDAMLRREIQHRLDAYSQAEYRWAVHVTNGVALVGGEFDDNTERTVVAILAATVPGVTDVVVSQPQGERRACG